MLFLETILPRILFSVIFLALAALAHAQTDSSGTQDLNDLQAPFSTGGAFHTSSADLISVQQRHHTTLHANAVFEAFVVFQIAEGWHVNAHRPLQPFLIGSTLEVASSPDLQIETSYFPDPLYRTFAFAHDTLAVYQGEVTIILSGRTSETILPGSYTLPGKLRVQACNDQVCLKPSTLDIPLVFEVIK